MNFAIIVPTLNAARDWPRFANGLLQGADPGQVLIVDSSSSDGTVGLARAAGFRVLSIDRASFNHGGTRQRAAQFVPEADILVYLTQDAILAGPNSLRDLVAAFTDPSVGAAFGRQLPRAGAGAIEAHARLFNYPGQSSVRNIESRRSLGFKAIFSSNSFGAYRRSALDSVAGFPGDVIFGEDTVTVARMLLRGWRVAYVAQAEVYHSHQYALHQEFKRYFDIGVLHSRESWLSREFGGVGGEGRRFVASELKYLAARHPASIPSALLRTALKLAGYKAGRAESKLHIQLKQRLSMHRFFWAQPAAVSE